MVTARFRFTTLTQLPKRRFERVSMEPPQMAGGCFYVASGCLCRDEGHRGPSGDKRAGDCDT
jgi:hypothetical protein